MSWITTDRKKQVFDRHYKKQFTKALNNQLEQAYGGFELLMNPLMVENQAQRITEEPIRKVFNDLYRRVAVDFMVYTTEGFKSDNFHRKRLEIPNEAPIITSAASFEYLWATQVNQWIIENVGDRITTITETSRNEWIKIVREITQEAIDQGLSMPDTMKLLQDRIPQQWRNTLFRAETIARTEVLSASNVGSDYAARATGLSLSKVWVARLDGRERPSHRAANGQVRLMNEDFIVDGEPLKHPGDIRGEAGNVINCRCQVQYIRTSSELNL